MAGPDQDHRITGTILSAGEWSFAELCCALLHLNTRPPFTPAPLPSARLGHPLSGPHSLPTASDLAFFGSRFGRTGQQLRAVTGGTTCQNVLRTAARAGAVCEEIKLAPNSPLKRMMPRALLLAVVALLAVSVQSACTDDDFTSAPCAL